MDLQNAFTCAGCGKLVEELDSVYDSRSGKAVWVCEECYHSYDPLTDPDCMID
jgi:hypothetical protein